jgi:two-component system, NarL family, nitrate/nitrite sensor histidine kinase NarX
LNRTCNDESGHVAPASRLLAAGPAMKLRRLLPSPQRLSTKIVGTLLGFMLLALFAVGSTLFLSWQLEGSSAAINEAGSVRMHGYRLINLMARWTQEPDDVQAKQKTWEELQAIDTIFAELDRGNPQRPLFLPPAIGIQTDFQQVSARWLHEIRPLAAATLAVDATSSQRQANWGRLQQQIDGFVADVNRLVRSIEQDSEQRTSWLRTSQFVLVVLALIGTVLMIWLMYVLIIEPVARLQKGILRMTEKDFGVRLPVAERDEFGQLAEAFNQMADRLEGLYNNLENRVRDKTEKLEEQNRELALLYDSAAFLQLPQPVEAVCQGFMQRISQYFQADGCTVRVLDPHRGNIYMLVQQGISEVMAETEQCMKVGDCLCGAAASEEVSMVYDLRRVDAGNKLQCHKDGFATVSVFHIHAHQQHLGFFNLYFRQPKEFSKNETALLDTLGQLLGVAIENIRLAMREREMAISEERNLVAQGLHDSIAQGLTFLNIQVQMLEDSLQQGKIDEVSEIVPALRTGVQESYEDVRELLLNFRSRLAEGDLAHSLQTTVEKFSRQTGIDARLLTELRGTPLSREQQLQMLFIVQEALSNIRKHAGASRVEVRLDERQDFTLSIHDNGVGFDATTLLQNGDTHVGIHIMRERAQRIGASFEVSSTPGDGTTVMLRLPREQRRAA